MSFLSEFANNLREARQANGLTQKQLAQQIGVANVTISMYENAKRMPNMLTLASISDVLNISLDDLVPCVPCQVQDDPSQMNMYDLLGEDDV